MGRKERAINKAIKKMDKEIDIIEMIKSRRFFKLAFRELLPAKKRMELKEKSRYIMVDPDNDTENENEDQKQEVMQFDNVLDLYEYELNQKSENLTDGFYSSGDDAEEEKNQGVVDSSQIDDIVNDGQINF